MILIPDNINRGKKEYFIMMSDFTKKKQQS